MNKADLIDALANEIGITRHEAKAVIKTILETMTSALACGESIEIRGFGSITVKQYKSYEGRNPKTGEKTFVKPKKLPFFKPGKDLKEQVNENGKG
jgi:integration host factor subunit beta